MSSSNEIIISKQLTEASIPAAWVGCGTHTYRNLLPCLNYTPFKIIAVCDPDDERAKAMASRVNASSIYCDIDELLENDGFDVVFLVVNYDEVDRPRYPMMVEKILKKGLDVWMEKPPAATSGEVLQMLSSEKESGKTVAVGVKKAFIPANRKAFELSQSESFGKLQFASFQYPVKVPTQAQFDSYLAGNPCFDVRMFLDHNSHFSAVINLLFGKPSSLYYTTNSEGYGTAIFERSDGAIANLNMLPGSSVNGGLERSMLVGSNNSHIVVDNNFKLSLHRLPDLGYGNAPNFYIGSPEEATAVWEPEMTYGQFYNSSGIIQGFIPELLEFSQALKENRSVSHGTLNDALVITRIFEAFAKGPGKTHSIEE